MSKINQVRDQDNKDKVNLKPFLTVEEACTYLDLSKSALYKKMSRREISYYVPGGKKAYFLRDSLDNWVLRNKVESIENLRRRADEALERYGQEKQFSTAGTSSISKKIKNEHKR